ncbi:MAG TPA: PAS domain-containing protein [Caulobacteraceae bacterium]|nr:PAS domain-containing protein [Caulobacteraceae bacterium]
MVKPTEPSALNGGDPRLAESAQELARLLPLQGSDDPLRLAERLAGELERRVSERTAALSLMNDELRRELAGRPHPDTAKPIPQLDLRQLVDSMPALVVVFSPTGQIEQANQRALSFFGRATDEIQATLTRDLVHPHDLDRATRTFTASLASGDPFEIELRIRRSDGVYPWHQARATPLRGADGGIERWYVMVTDIDERKRVEDALRAREVSAHLLVESMDGIPALAIISNEAGEIVFANRQVLEYYDRTLEEVKRWPTSVHIVHPDDLEHANQVVADALRAGTPVQDEYRLRRFDGVYRWFEGRYSPVRGPDGRITNWYVLLIDIDDRKRSDERLRQSEAKLAAEKRPLEMVARGAPIRESLEELCRQVEGLVPECLCSILLVEPGGERFRLGAGPSLPDAYNDFLDGVAIAPGGGPCGLAVSKKTPVIATDLANAHRWALSGAMTAHGLASAWSTPILSGDGVVLATFAIYWREVREPTSTEQEIVDRFTPIVGIAVERAAADATLREREADLERAQAHLTEAQRLSKTGSFTWDERLGEDVWSEELYRIFGLEPSARMTWPLIRQYIHPDDLPAVEAANHQSRTGDEHDSLSRIVTPQGELKHIRTVGHRSEINRHLFYGAVQDVTESVLAQQALNQAQSELARMARVTALSALSASVAHEVNQPLAGIITNASTCLRMLAADPPDLEGAMRTAQRTIRDGNRASEVIDRLRRLFARQPPAIAPLDLNETAREVLSLSSSELQRRRISLRTALADDLPQVRGDRVQLQQVILNLVLNAADSMSEVSDRPRELLVASERDRKDWVRLSVRDAGAGLDPETAGRVFDAFYTTKPDGMGIGLSISRSIVEAHEGRLWAEPNEDAPGATFSFSIPSAERRPAKLARGGPRRRVVKSAKARKPDSPVGQR